jgi:hypothetical protein
MDPVDEVGPEVIGLGLHGWSCRTGKPKRNKPVGEAEKTARGHDGLRVTLDQGARPGDGWQGTRVAGEDR